MKSIGNKPLLEIACLLIIVAHLIAISIFSWGGGVLVVSRGTLDINRKLAMRISITSNSQYPLRRRNDLSHMIT